MEKSNLFAYLCFWACEGKSLYNRNVGPTKPEKVLYEQNLVYWDQLKIKIILITVAPLN